MAHNIIRLQDDYFFQLASTGTLIQPEALAVNVSPYRFVTPWVRIRTSADNSLSGGGSVTFKWKTAAVLLTPEESSSSGERFVDCSNADITISDTYAGLANPGKSYTLDPPGTGLEFLAIVNPGGLMIWECVSTYMKAVAFRADIYLVCRD